LVWRSSRASAGLAIEGWEIAEILAIVLDQVEGVEDGGTRGIPSTQIIEA
jgi:hypothetical protein